MSVQPTDAKGPTPPAAMNDAQNPVKLAALDAEDLAVISAHVQDAVLKVGDIQWSPRERRFLVIMNRFVWEKAVSGRRRGSERRRAVLHFDRVEAVRTSQIRQDAAETVLALLAVTFEAGVAPSGAIVLTFSGGAAIRLDVECIEAQLTDLGAAWVTHARPKHNLKV